MELKEMMIKDVKQRTSVKRWNFKKIKEKFWTSLEYLNRFQLEEKENNRKATLIEIM